MQVRAEIQEHYESAREAAISEGATGDEGDRLAVETLGKATTANRQYRKVLLTAAEARVLRDGDWEARVICANSRLKMLLLSIPGAAVLVALVATVLLLTGTTAMARVLLIGGIGVGILLGMPFLPVYTPSRSRICRYVKWAVLCATLLLAFGPDALRWSWLLFSCLWPMMWTDWNRMSIRRKLPVTQWPKHLYL
jgi:hypothetical protein